jgi:UDP-N-acetylglucosamine--N-acetylmuramyl-(pentapeptide) pyrophosphoryl-undecaprenol N-acetylglucosamine transferase
LKRKTLSLIFAGGGTGGHVYPAIAIAEEIRRRYPEAKIVFVGTAKKIEARIVPAKGFEFHTIWISGFARRLSFGLLLFPLKLIVAMVQSIVLLARHRPDAVVGTGGYVCGPVVFAAQRMNIPTLVQEQNGVPGETTRLLAPHATEVHVTFETTKAMLRRKDNVRVSGTPVREAIGQIRRSDGAAEFGMNPGATTLLVFGGSLGAASINRALAAAIPEFVNKGIQIIWQTGEQEFHAVSRSAVGFESMVVVRRFIDRMEMAYAASDLAVCRSGASSLAELTCAGLPSVLVPYPHATADHQTKNAESMQRAGASVLVPDAQAQARLTETVIGLLSDAGTLQTMAQHTRALGKPEAARMLADAVLRCAGWMS